MNQGLIPRRYAKALFKLAVERGSDSRLYKLMSELAVSFAAAPDLQRAISNPFVASDDKVKLLSAAAGADKKDTDFADFLKLLVQNNRIALAQEIALAYCDIYRKGHNIYVVNVTSAAKLDAAEEKRLKSMIEEHLGGGAMEYSSRVDPDLIGGFVISINNERLDASVANELEQLRLKLLTKK